MRGALFLAAGLAVFPFAARAEDPAYTIKGKDWSKDRLVGFVTYSV